MKKLSFLAASMITVFALPAQSALLLGADAGLNYWFSDSKIDNLDYNNVETNVSFNASVEHFIPLVPNAKFGYSSVSGGIFTDYSQYDLIGYYEILDNDLLSFDLGLNFQHFSGKFQGLDLDLWQPNLYSRAEVGIPNMPVSIFGSFSYGTLDKVSTVDLEAGVQYTLDLVAADVNFNLGYRMQDNDFDLKLGSISAGKIETTGFFIGASVGI